MREENGITLVALVVTVILLIILAAISVTNLTSQDKDVINEAKKLEENANTMLEKRSSNIADIISEINSSEL